MGTNRRNNKMELIQEALAAEAECGKKSRYVDRHRKNRKRSPADALSENELETITLITGHTREKPDGEMNTDYYSEYNNLEEEANNESNDETCDDVSEKANSESNNESSHVEANNKSINETCDDVYEDDFIILNKDPYAYEEEEVPLEYQRKKTDIAQAQKEEELFEIYSHYALNRKEWRSLDRKRDRQNKDKLTSKWHRLEKVNPNQPKPTKSEYLLLNLFKDKERNPAQQRLETKENIQVRNCNRSRNRG